MNYYQNKILALKEIRELKEKKIDLNDIQFYILEKYGLSYKLTASYFQELTERGF